MVRSISVYTADESAEGVKDERCETEDPEPASERHPRHHPASVVGPIGRFPGGLLLALHFRSTSQDLFLATHGSILQDWWARLELHQHLIHVTDAFCF